jgi:hypothetical protein
MYLGPVCMSSQPKARLGSCCTLVTLCCKVPVGDGLTLEGPGLVIGLAQDSVVAGVLALELLDGRSPELLAQKGLLALVNEHAARAGYGDCIPCDCPIGGRAGSSGGHAH